MTNAWGYVQSISAGASSKVCAMGNQQEQYKFDTRAYGFALEQTGYPLIRQWLHGRDGGTADTEYLRFAKDAISRGSAPMLHVVAAGAMADKGRVKVLVDGLDDSKRTKFFSSLNIAAYTSETPRLMGAYVWLVCIAILQSLPSTGAKLFLAMLCAS